MRVFQFLITAFILLANTETLRLVCQLLNCKGGIIIYSH